MEKIKILVIIILVIIIAFLIKIFCFNGNGEKSFDRNYVLSLLGKGENYENYLCEYINFDGTKMSRKFKDDTLVVSTDEIISYQYYNKNKHIVINKKMNTAMINDLDSPNLLTMDKLYCKDFIDLVKNDKVEYKYLRDESYNNLECIVIQLKYLNEIGTEYNYLNEIGFDSLNSRIELWISKESGLIAKCNIESKSNSNETHSKQIDYNLKLKVVTDDEINEPDLRGYTVVNL